MLCHKMVYWRWMTMKIKIAFVSAQCKSALRKRLAYSLNYTQKKRIPKLKTLTCRKAFVHARFSGAHCNRSTQTCIVADPGFPRRGRQAPRWGANLLFDQFFPKLHEHERNWTQRGACPWRPLRSANAVRPRAATSVLGALTLVL